MKCIYCDNKTSVKCTIATDKSVIRERQCKVCKKTFHTEERSPDDVTQYILKRKLGILRQKRKDELKEETST